MAASSSNPRSQLLPEDVRVALHQIALDQLELGRVKLSSQLLLSVVLAEHPGQIQNAFELLTQESPEPIMVAWLLALTGDHATFETLDVSTLAEGEIRTYYPRLPSRRFPVPWKAGYQTLMFAFIEYATFPALNSAVHFLYPRYYSGPLYRGLESVVEYENEQLLKLLLADLDNPAVLQFSSQGELRPDLKSTYYQQAISKALREGKVGMLEIFLKFRPSLNLKFYFLELTLPIVDALAQVQPQTLLDQAHLNYSEKIAQPAVAMEVALKLPLELLQKGLAFMFCSLAMQMLDKGFYEAAVVLASRVPSYQLKLVLPLSYYGPINPEAEARRLQDLTRAVQMAARMGASQVHLQLEALIEEYQHFLANRRF